VLSFLLIVVGFIPRIIIYELRRGEQKAFPSANNTRVFPALGMEAVKTF